MSDWLSEPRLPHAARYEAYRELWRHLLRESRPEALARQAREAAERAAAEQDTEDES